MRVSGHGIGGAGCPGAFYGDPWAESRKDSGWAVSYTHLILVFEKTRRELRDLMKFLVDDAEPKKRIITNLTDPVIDTTEGKQLDPAYDFEDYKKTVSYTHLGSL